MTPSFFDIEDNNFIASFAHPARYLGREVLSVVKDLSQIRLTLALVFPEIYEIAMSNLGIKILYESLASRLEVSVERVFAPWVDLMEEMYSCNISPWSLETGRALENFDVIAFSFQYELTYTNALHMLRLAGIPLRREHRSCSFPLVIAGGPCLVNPEPIADFLDLAVVGEAEELIHLLVDLFIQAKEESWARDRLYRESSRLEGVYAPDLFMPVYENNRLIEIRSLDPELFKVHRRVVRELDAYPPPTRQIVPAIKLVHDRLGIEVARGCTQGCRFCQAGYIYRPIRERNPQLLLETVLANIIATGFDEVGLLSLSIGDYSCIEPLIIKLMNILEKIKVGLSLPSLRIDSFSPELAMQIKRVRKTGFTLAPEVGSQKLRQVINKKITNEQILATVNTVFLLGWNLVKLYFMVGVPEEIDSDLIEISRLCNLIVDNVGNKKQEGGKNKKPLVHVSLGVFIPKPHTPFQWEAQLSLKEANRRLAVVKTFLNDRRIKFKWNSTEQSLLEGILSRGDRRLSKVLELAVENGCRFDGWSEELNMVGWFKALAESGLKLEDYLRARATDEVLPWDHIDARVDKEFLLAERARAQAGKYTSNCRHGECHNCGVCDHKIIKPRLAQQNLGLNIRTKQGIFKKENQKQTFRFRLEKTGPARFFSHLEMMKQLQRAFRRSRIEVAYSQGFHPQPLLKTVSALPLGVESLVETLETTLLLSHWTFDQLSERLNKALPEGLKLAGARLVYPDEKLIEHTEVVYLIRTQIPLTQERLSWFNQIDTIILMRKTPKKQFKINLKLAIKKMKIIRTNLILVVDRVEGGRPKPAEVLELVFGLSSREALSARVLKIACRSSQNNF